MLCSIGHGEIPNLNFLFAPSCHRIGTPINPQILKQQNLSISLNPFLCNKLFVQKTTFLKKSHILVPRVVDVKVLENNNEEREQNCKIIKENQAPMSMNYL